MFLLDTNVLSALMYPIPVPEVVRWATDRPYGELFTASVCQAEILAGLAVILGAGGESGSNRRRTECLATILPD
jgi:predicted nucleic acid-binding protein